MGGVAGCGAPGVLWAAWARVAAGSAQPGVDGVTPAGFAADLAHHLDILGAELREGTYRCQPVRGLELPRAGSKPRRLGLPTVRDRVVQRAVLQVFRRGLDADAAEVSFAYRKGRSWLDALNQAGAYRDRGLRVVARSDVRNFFDSIDHGLLRDVVTRALGDMAVVDLLLGWATAPRVSGNTLRPRLVGIPQGAPISPALANLYLRGFDTEVHARYGQLVRYADDIAVFCRDEAGAFVAQAHVAAVLSRQRLETNGAKTYVSSFDRGFSMLGWVFFGDRGWPEQPRPHWRHPLDQRPEDPHRPTVHLT